MAGDLEAADEALIRRMRLVDEYLECHKRIATVLKEAYFEMALAKKAMGQGRITELQYDSRMRATVAVTCDDDKYDLASADTRDKPAEQKSEEPKGAVQRSRSKKKDSTTDDKNDTSKPDAPANSKVHHADEPKHKDDEQKAPVDPLYWFGYLPSPHLRRSQAHFKQVVPLYVELANVARQLAFDDAGGDQTSEE